MAYLSYRRQPPRLVNLHSFGLVASLVNTLLKWPPSVTASRTPMLTNLSQISFLTSPGQCSATAWRAPQNWVNRGSWMQHSSANFFPIYENKFGTFCYIQKQLMHQDDFFVCFPRCQSAAPENCQTCFYRHFSNPPSLKYVTLSGCKRRRFDQNSGNTFRWSCQAPHAIYSALQKLAPSFEPIVLRLRL